VSLWSINLVYDNPEIIIADKKYGMVIWYIISFKSFPLMNGFFEPQDQEMKIIQSLSLQEKNIWLRFYIKEKLKLTYVETFQESKIPFHTFFLPTLVLRTLDIWIKHNFWLPI